ncbi:sporulation protein SPS19 [Myriangium duriaei CBS 260.36]|uniref:2,4-dienoyl-CoA reductase [(3E)-enoyl-CoA-producing] n=1 Tax=Myriangium duriaei CBS 260.36 TaxID=1168546 RepID=A0A9P4J480_9PEZI|nr:sporulation protein SPS19 [Myriangium duriaei CBS 260.36]
MPLDPSTYVSPIYRPSLFNGKVVFCTGGNGTICSAQVRALVHLGANACIVGRNPDKTASAAADIATARPGSKVLGIGSVDVRDVSSVGAAVDRCIQELGGIDFLIAGAAGNFLSPLSTLSPNAFKSVMDIDVLGSFNALKPCLPHLLSSRSRSPSSGRVIFISATFHYTGHPLQSHVAAAKAAVDALAASVAIEYGPRGLTSNVIAPGPIADTEGMKRLGGLSPEEGGVARAVPLQRLGTVRDIADATVYLFSEAGAYVNGHVLVVDGGAWRTMGAADPQGAVYPGLFLEEKEEKAKL